MDANANTYRIAFRFYIIQSIGLMANSNDKNILHKLHVYESEET